MNERSIEKLVDDTLQSFEDVKRAEPKPFLFSRVMASINRRSSFQSSWTKLGVFISRPRTAIAGLVLVILINATTFFIRKNNVDKQPMVQGNSIVTDEFAINAGNIYEIENPEQ